MRKIVFVAFLVLFAQHTQAAVLQAYPEPTETALYGYNGAAYSIIRMPNLIRPVRYVAIAVTPTGYGGSSYTPEYITIHKELPGGIPWENCTTWSASSTATGCSSPYSNRLIVNGATAHVALVGGYHIYDLGQDVYLSSKDNLILTWDRSSLSLQKIGQIINYGATFNSAGYGKVGDFSPSIFLCDTLEDCAVTWWAQDYNSITYDPQTLNTRFQTVSNASYSTSTQTFNFDVSQFIDTSEIIKSQADRNITLHSVLYNWGTSSTAFAQQGFEFTPANGNSTTTILLTDDRFTGNGRYTFKVNFGNLATGITDIYAFPDTFLYFDMTLNNGVVTNFNVDDAYYPTTEIETGINCETFDIGCQFKRALIYVLKPSTNSFTQFFDLKDELSNVKPFGYITVVYDQLNNLNASSTGAYTMPQIPFFSAIFNPLRSAMSVILWGIFALVFYNKRLKHLDI